MNFENYKIKMKFPRKGDYFINKCTCGHFLPNNHKYKFCPECGENITEMVKTNLDKYKKDVKAYRDEEKRLHELFKDHALEYVGLKNHKNAEKIFNYIWDEKHSGSLCNVLYGLEEISTLFD